MPDDAFTRKQACPNCNELIYVNFPGTPIQGFNENVQYCPKCNKKIVAVRHSDGSTNVRIAFFQK